jgi:uncharacterized protein (DUF488 family)
MKEKVNNNTSVVTVYTIGHSTRPIDKFIELLKAHEIEIVVDVRTIPKSRRNPQYNELDLKNSLLKHQIQYIHIKGLGGLRHTTKQSVNVGWKNPSFRGYADYMQTREFVESLAQLIKLADKARVAIMCAEAVPWRCHRSLIGDALLVRHILVKDIISEKSIKPHTLTWFARVDGHDITYPEESSSQQQQ